MKYTHTYMHSHTHAVSPVASSQYNHHNIAGLQLVFDPEVAAAAARDKLAAAVAAVAHNQHTGVNALASSQLPASSSQILPGGLILASPTTLQPVQAEAQVYDQKSVFSSHGSARSENSPHRPPSMVSPKVVQVRNLGLSSKAMTSTSPKSASGYNVYVPIRNLDGHASPSAPKVATYGLVQQSLRLPANPSASVQEERAALVESRNGVSHSGRSVMQDSTNKMRHTGAEAAINCSGLAGVTVSRSNAGVEPPPRKKHIAPPGNPGRNSRQSSPVTYTAPWANAENLQPSIPSSLVGAGFVPVRPSLSSNNQLDSYVSAHSAPSNPSPVYSSSGSRSSSMAFGSRGPSPHGLEIVTTADNGHAKSGSQRQSSPAWRDGWYHREGYNAKPRTLLLL